MEPDDIEIIPENKPEPGIPAPDSQADAADLHNEGVDIVGSSVALDNEFSKPEQAAYSGTIEDVAAEPPMERDIDEDAKMPEAAPAPGAKAVPEPPIRPVAPVTPAPIPAAPIPTPPPAPTPAPKPVTPVPPAASVPPRPSFVPPQEPKPLQNDPSIKPLRTFKSDAEEAVKYGGISRADIAVAEQKKREKITPIKYQEERRASPGLYIGIVALIVVLLAGGWYYWFSSSTATPQGKIVAPKVTLIGIVPFAKASIVVLDPSVNPIDLIAAKIAATTPSLGTVAAIAPVESATSTTMSPVSDVVSSTHIPNRLLRSLASDYMVGSYEYDVQSPFIILKNTFFQNAYAGMLEWESQIGTDLTPFIQISDATVTTADADTATFSDAVISNVNARLLKNSSGKTILAYAFADKDTVVITTSENALKYLLNQILQVRTIQ